MLLRCFPGETGNQGRPKTDIRNLSSQFLGYVSQFLFGGSSAHPFQDVIIGVLNRKIQVMAYLLFLLHNLNQFVRNLLRIAVKYPYPADPLYSAQLF